MATELLQIEWLPQPSNFPEDKQSLVIKDPLPVIATLLNFTPPSEEDKAEWPGPKSLEEFWLMLQHFLKVEINEQLSHIHDIAIRYQEANAIQIGCKEWVRRGEYDEAKGLPVWVALGHMRVIGYWGSD